MLNYKNIAIRAGAHIHEACIEIVKRNFPQSSRIFDIAAGAGAFSMRLRDAGYEVVANDLDEAGWNAPGIPKLSLDLNSDFPVAMAQPPYDLVVAMEIIEHLNNPEKLLQDCKMLLKPDGRILLSTPNVMDSESRLIYLRKGMFYHFSPQSYAATGHQTILPYWLLEIFFHRNQLEIVERKFAGSRTSGLGFRNAKELGFQLAASLLRPFMKTHFPGELTANCIIYLLRAAS